MKVFCMEFQFEVDNKIEKIANPGLKDIFAILEQMNPKTSSVCTLENEEGSSVQWAGTKLRMMIERRK